MHNTIEKNGLSKSALQTIAIIAMVIDHLAQFTTNIYLYYIMKLIGRITIVIMCYFVAEGYYKTSNIGRYLLRLGIFAVISQIPYYLMIRHGNFPNGILPLGYSILMNRNVIFTLFVGLALLAIIKSDSTNALKIIGAAAALWLVRCSDWGYTAVLWIVGFGVFHDSIKKQNIWFSLVLGLNILITAVRIILNVLSTRSLLYSTLFGFIAMFGGFFALPLISAYNGERGKAPKWVFYIFYPTHMLLIAIIYILLMK